MGMAEPGPGDMALERHGKTWTQEEIDRLFALVRSDATVDEVAATLGRTVLAVCLRIDSLVDAGHPFDRPVEAFEWARAEMRKGRSFVRSPYGGTHVLQLWLSITGIELTARDQQLFLERPEVTVLAGFEHEQLEAAGTELWTARHQLSLRSWVLECDWPGVEYLHITPAEVRDSSDTVGVVGGELVEAALRRIPNHRNREIMAARVGLRGNSVTLQAIADQHGISGERVRQIQSKELRRLGWQGTGTVRRSWHHVRDVLRSALINETKTELDPTLVHSFVQLALPAAPLAVATNLVARLCGQKSCDQLVADVNEIERMQLRRHKQELAEMATRARINARMRLLVDAAAWPENPHGNSPLLHNLSPQREPVGSGGVKSITGRWQSDKVGREVGHESGVELQMMRLLDATPMVTSYCEQPVVVPYQVDGDTHDYYPDLLVRLEDGRNLLVELKSRLYDFAIWPNQAKFAAATRFAHDHGWGFLAVTAGTMTLRDLIEWQPDLEFEARLRHRLIRGPMNWRSVNDLRRRFDASLNDVAALVWRNHWRWQDRPYRLSASINEA